MVPQPYMEEVAAQTVTHHVDSPDGLWFHDGGPGLKTHMLEVMPKGTQFNVICWNTGDYAPNSKNNVWLHGTYQSPKHGLVEGDASDVGIDTHWQAYSDLTKQGIPKCRTTPATPPAPAVPPSESAARPPQPKSVFYSPWTIPSGLSDVKGVADQDISVDVWSEKNSGSCNPNLAVNIPESVETLSGWSRGRMGVIYFMAKARPERLKNIHKIVLFDPGSSRNIGGDVIAGFHRDVGCDYKFDPGDRLTKWLNDPEHKNQLTIVAGAATEEKVDESDPNSKSTFKGMWQYYLQKIWNQPFADRARICDYNNLDHDNTLRLYADIVKSSSNTCPPARSGNTLTQWHP